MNDTPLFRYFEVTSTGIRPTTDDIPREAFRAAIEQYLDLIRHNSFKLGDLLTDYRARYGNDVQDYLIPWLVSHERQKKSNLEKCMWLANGFPHRERFPDLDQSHHWEVQAVQNAEARRDILEQVRSERAAGRDVDTDTVRKMAHEAKLVTGQGIRRHRGKSDKHLS